MFKQAERLHSQANSSVAQINSQLNYIAKRNEEQARQLESIKETRQDNEQNVKLQSFAKQARESAESQQETAQNVTEQLRETVRQAHSAMKDLHDLLVKYEQLEADRSSQRLIDNYELIKQTASGLRSEAALQKQILDENLVEVKEFIKKLNKFKVPDEQRTDAFNQEVKISLDKLNAKVCNYFSDLTNIFLILIKFIEFYRLPF